MTQKQVYAHPLSLKFIVQPTTIHSNFISDLQLLEKQLNSQLLSFTNNKSKQSTNK